MMTSGASAATKPTLRTDLRLLPQWRAGRRWWIIHDPIKNHYQRIADGDFQALMTGQAPAALWYEAEQMGWVQGGQPLRSSNSWRQWLAWRLPGIPMDTIAQSLVKYTGWCLSYPAIILWMLLIASAWITLAVNWERLLATLPALQQFVSTKNALSLLWITLGSKAIHELGHALACKRLGARVGDIGIILLCGTPCLFCDVTATWDFPNANIAPP